MNNIIYDVELPSLLFDEESDDTEWDHDIVVHINGHKYTLHKTVFEDSSEYFENKMKKDNKKLTIVIDESIKPKVIKSVIDYFYTKKIVGLTLEYVEDLFRLLKIFKCRQHVFTYCNNYVESQMNVQTVVKIHLLAERTGNNELVERSKKFELDHFSEIIYVEDFINLGYDQMSALLTSDELQLLSEETAFRGLEIWYLSNRAERRHHFFCLLNFIRMQFLSRKFVVKNVLPLCEVDEIGCEIISRCILPQECALNSKPRRRNYVLLAIFPKMIMKYDFVKNSWEKHANKNWIPDELCPPIFAENTIIIANEDGPWSISLPTCDITLMATIEFTKEPINDLAIVVLNNLLFVFCDFKLYAYDVKERRRGLMWKWKVVAIEKRKMHATVVHKGKMFIFGGINRHREVLRSAEMYDPVANKWEKLPPMSLRRLHCQAIVLGHNIYLIDCRSGICCMEKFNTIKKTWSIMASIPDVVSKKLRTVAYKDCLITFGQKHNWLYNPLIDKWTKFEEIKTIDEAAHIMLVPRESIEKTDGN